MCAWPRVFGHGWMIFVWNISGYFKYLNLNNLFDICRGFWSRLTEIWSGHLLKPSQCWPKIWSRFSDFKQEVGLFGFFMRLWSSKWNMHVSIMSMKGNRKGYQIKTASWVILLLHEAVKLWRWNLHVSIMMIKGNMKGYQITSKRKLGYLASLGVGEAHGEICMSLSWLLRELWIWITCLRPWDGLLYQIMWYQDHVMLTYLHVFVSQAIYSCPCLASGNLFWIAHPIQACG